ncbi:MAG: PF20097 family protein [Succiniclasticum sp.]|jgi:hypothetical protein|nr:PF20097 family protein [Succiniclasticum sp.]
MTDIITPVTCPCCGQEMEAGDVISDNPCALFWAPADPKRRALACRGFRGMLKSVVVKNLVQITLKGNYCHHCKKLLIDTELQK